MMIAVAKHPAVLPNAVYVGRTRSAGKQYPTAYHQLANPFRIGADGSREEVVAKYRQWLFQRIKIGTSTIRYALLALLEQAKTTGVVLVCHCTNNLVGGPLGDECHAQVVARALEWMERERERIGFYPTCAKYWEEVA